MLKTSGYALGFQHSPRDLANVNEWKIMFDPYIVVVLCLSKSLHPSQQFFTDNVVLLMYLIPCVLNK